MTVVTAVVCHCQAEDVSRLAHFVELGTALRSGYLVSCDYRVSDWSPLGVGVDHAIRISQLP